MTRQCAKCESPIGVQFDACGSCGAPAAALAVATQRARCFRFRYSTRTLLLTMTALAPTFLLSQRVWEQFLLALAVGAIATAVGGVATRALIDGMYRARDWWTGRRS